MSVTGSLLPPPGTSALPVPTAALQATKDKQARATACQATLILAATWLFALPPVLPVLPTPMHVAVLQPTVTALQAKLDKTESITLPPAALTPPAPVYTAVPQDVQVEQATTKSL